MEWMRDAKLESKVDATHPRVCGRVLTTIKFFLPKRREAFSLTLAGCCNGAAYRRSEECVCVCVKD